MDVRTIIGNIDINVLASSAVACFGTITLTGATQIVYCTIALFSFLLTLVHSIDKHKRRMKELDLNNKLLEQQIEKNKVKDESKT